MRLFVGVHLPEELEGYLAQLQEKLHTPAARQSFNKNFDLTLKFLAEVPPEKAEKVKEQLKKLEFEKFDAVVSGTGAFPDEKNPRVVWAGVEPRDRFVALQAKVENALAGLFDREERFVPHLTLSRVKEVYDSEGFGKTLKLKVEQRKFAVCEIDLVESILATATHKILLSVKAKV